MNHAKVNLFVSLVWFVFLFPYDTQAQSMGICDRTPQIRDEILTKLGTNQCKDVTPVQLATISEIAATNKAISTLQEGDFAGLTGLKLLVLDNNHLTSLPEGLFDELRNLTDLNLTSNSLDGLPKGLFAELDSLKLLRLDSNRLVTLHQDLFDGLTNLSALYLTGNPLTKLDKDLFKGLNGLERLACSRCSLSNLDSDLFHGLSNLKELDLHGNRLTSLPQDLFDGLTSLRGLFLTSNRLTKLHEDLFDGLTNLEWLRLRDNSLAELHEDLFDELTSLFFLSLNQNRLTSLPDNLFDHKIADPILDVYLRGNKIKCFPASIINNPYVVFHPDNKACALPVVTLDLSDEIISEDGGQTILTATLDTLSSEVTTVMLGISPDSDVDYEVDTNPLAFTIPAGKMTSAAIKITALDNDMDEPDKAFTITGTSSENVTGPEDITFTIEDDEETPTLTLVLTEKTISEDGGQTKLTAMLDNPLSEVITVTLTADPPPPADYTVDKPLILTIPARARVSDAITITAVDNAMDEPDKTITITGTSEHSQGIRGPAAITLTITDDDTRLPRLRLILDPARISEARGVSRVTAALDAPAATPMTVEITAAESVRLSLNRTLSIAAGAVESSGEVMITAVENEVDAPDQVVRIFGSSSETGIGSAFTLLTIEDDDDAPTATLHLSRNPIREGGESTTVTATLNHPSSEETTIVVSAVSDDSDLFSLSPDQTLTIAAGQTESTGLVTITSGDNDQHGANALVTVMGDPANHRGIQGPDAITLTITDDERPTVSLHLSESSISENGGTTTVTARLDSPSSTDLSILISTDPAPGSDYKMLVGDMATRNPVLTIAAGQRSSREQVTILAIDNDVYGPATKTLSISGAAPEQVNRPGHVLLTIIDDENPPTVDLVLTPGRISEHGGIAVLRARLSHRSSTDLPVMVSATPSASSYEWRGPSMLTIPAGTTESRNEVTITAVDNDLHDPDRTITFQGTVVNPDLTSPRPAVLTIVDDDGVPTATLHLSRNPIPENGGATTVTATLTHPSSASTVITVTALPWNPALFTLSELPTLTIAANQTGSTGRVMITAVDNAEYGPDQVVMVSGTARNLLGITGPAPVPLTIINDELAPLALSVYDTRVQEDQAAARLSVELNRPTDQVVTVQYQTLDQSAQEASDYTASRGMVVFGPQATRGFIQIAILADAIPEEAETFTVTLSNPRNAQIKRGLGTVTIVEAVSAPSLSIHDEVGGAADGRIRFRVSLSHASRQMVTVRYQTQDGTAKAGQDYTPATGMLTFAPGQTEAVVPVALLGKDLDWHQETFSVHLVDSEHAQIVKAVAVATIRETDQTSRQVLSAYRPRFVRTSSVQIVEALSERFRSGTDGSACGAGTRADLARLWQWTPSLGELLSGCRVSQNAGAFGVWGRGAFRRFHGQGEMTLRASVSTAMVGADYRWNERWTAGLALAHSRGDGSYDLRPQSGTIASGLTGMYPYIGYQRRGMEVWMTGGYGWGTVQVSDLETDLAAGFGAMGIRGRVRTGLSYRGDVLVADADGPGGDVYRIRLGMEGELHLHEGVHPYVEANVRQDGGSAETGLGLELGGGVRVSVPAWGLKGELRSQGVIVHSVTGFREWGISGSLQYGGGPRGILVRIRPSWGPGQGMATYHSQTILDAVPQGRALDRTEVEIGYGIALQRGEARSVMGITRLSEGAMIRLGGELRPWERFRVSVFGLAHAQATALGPLGLHVQGALQY